MSEESEVIIKKPNVDELLRSWKSESGICAHQPGRWTDCGAACELRKTVNLKHTHQAIEDDLTRSSTKCTMTVGARETIGRVSPDTGLDQIAGRDG